MSRKIFIYVHIPKCGGTTFQNILARNFKKGLYQDYSLLQNYTYTSSQIEELINYYPDLTCYSSHKVSLDLPFKNEGFDITAISFIRDPIDRFVSDYFYQRFNKNAFVPEAKEMELEEYIDWGLKEGNKKMYINGQTRFLSGRPDKEGFSKIENIVKERDVYLFPLDRMNEACLFLEKKYPEYFKDCSYTRRNISKKDQILTPDLREKISKYCKNDLELLNFANNHLDREIKESFSNEELEGALEGLKKRNRTRRVTEGLSRYMGISIIKRMLGRV